MISHLDDYRPHLSIQVGDDIHIMPLQLLQDVADGKRKFTDIADWDKILPVIISDYLKDLEERPK